MFPDVAVRVCRWFAALAKNLANLRNPEPPPDYVPTWPPHVINPPLSILETLAFRLRRRLVVLRRLLAGQPLHRDIYWRDSKGKVHLLSADAQNKPVSKAARAWIEAYIKAVNEGMSKQLDSKPDKKSTPRLSAAALARDRQPKSPEGLAMAETLVKNLNATMTPPRGGKPTSGSDHYEWMAAPRTCPKCGWKGTGKDTTTGEAFREGSERHCPVCDHYFGFVMYPLISETLVDPRADELDRLFAKVVMQRVAIAKADEVIARARISEPPEAVP
jgi:hypothetical protein